MTLALAIPKSQQAAEVVSPGDDFKIIISRRHPRPHPRALRSPRETNMHGHSEVRAVLAWSPYCSIIGHEGVGTTVQTGPGVPASSLGHRVGVKWLYSACNNCSLCKQGYQHNCPSQVNTSRHVPGTLQQYVVADNRFTTRLPLDLSDEIAAPLLCAGLTMAGALGKLDSVLEEGDTVVISGSGGGLGHIGVQIASRVKRFRVIAVDSGEEKKELSLASGAEVFIDYQREDVASRVSDLTGGEGAHATIVVPGTREAFAMAPHVVRNMGLIVCVGLPRNEMDLPISATLCAARGISIIGSSVGTEEQMAEILQLAAAGAITPSIQTFDFSHTPALIQGLKDDAVVGRVVVRIPQ